MRRLALIGIIWVGWGCQTPPSGVSTSAPEPSVDRPPVSAAPVEAPSTRPARTPKSEELSLNLADHGLPIMPGMKLEEHDDSAHREDVSGETWIHGEYVTSAPESEVLAFYERSLRDARRVATSVFGATSTGRDASIEVSPGDSNTRVTARVRVR